MHIDALHLQHSTVFVAVRSTLILLIMAFIIFSNIINIHILRKSREVQIFSRSMLITISAAGLLNGIFVCLPGFLASVMNGWPLGEIYCQFSSVLNGSSCAVTIWCLTAISLDRYVAIHHSIFYRNCNKLRLAIFMIGLFWVLGVISFSFPLIIKADFYNFHNNLLICTLPRHSDIFGIISTFFIYIISGFILTVTSFKIVMTLKNIKHLKGHSKKNAKRSRRQNAVNIILFSAICFLVSWGPYTIADILVCFKIIERIPANMDFIITWLANSNSFMTVLVYSGNSKEFRHHLGQILRNLFSKTQITPLEMNTEMNQTKCTSV